MLKLIQTTSLFVIALAVSSGAAAAIKTYGDSAAFQAAAMTTSLETFTTSVTTDTINSGVLNSSTTDYGFVPGDILPGVTYSTTIGSGYFFNVDNDGDGPFDTGFLDSTEGPRVLTIVFDHPQGAFGFDTDFLMPNFSVRIFDISGELYSHNFSVTEPDALQFFGFANSTATISKVEIAGIGRLVEDEFGFAIDDFRFNGIAVGSGTPEPEAWAMMIVGFGLIGLTLRGRRATWHASSAFVPTEAIAFGALREPAVMLLPCPKSLSSARMSVTDAG